MDVFTHKFLSMCEMAEEVQKAWKPEPFQDFIADKKNKIVSFLGMDIQPKAFLDPKSIVSHYTFGLVPVDLDEVFWVPTFEQILNLNGTGQPVVALFLTMANFTHSSFSYKSETNPLIVALAYVMYVHFGKNWNGCRWVDSGSPQIPR